jgi:hypothetical protein
MIVKPARPGLRVIDPVSRQPIPESGFTVSDTDTYWARRLADGDVVPVVPEKPAAKPAPKGKE